MQVAQMLLLQSQLIDRRSKTVGWMLHSSRQTDV
jgi:hypothetical protein